MTLIETIRKLGLENKKVEIFYWITAPNGSKAYWTVFCGRFMWHKGQTFPIDYDFYDIEDNVVDFQLTITEKNNFILTVWF